MKRLNVLKTPFYLTGGTALSRHYFNHRYSDDLDFFVNEDNRYGEWVRRIFQDFVFAGREGMFRIDAGRVIRGENFTQLYVTDDKTWLKIDLVHDVAPHFGGFEDDDVLGRVDSWQNILSNKISALGRLEIKDFVDLWVLAKHRVFSWKGAFHEAKQKDAGLDPVMIFELLTTIPKHSLAVIKWARPIDVDLFFADVGLMAEDMLRGRANSLFVESAGIE
ncbi:nucleotidyl transferase AbiEii/AbiGii toxin family protein [candidate division KSB1 bacterium]|nr:nucleotidyl transferase AbiEii/AbiGii toxin family protein [candidate division KSB1 bacterium]